MTSYLSSMFSPAPSTPDPPMANEEVARKVTAIKEAHQAGDQVFVKVKWRYQGHPSRAYTWTGQVVEVAVPEDQRDELPANQIAFPFVHFTETDSEDEVPAPNSVYPVPHNRLEYLEIAMITRPGDIGSRPAPKPASKRGKTIIAPPTVIAPPRPAPKPASAVRVPPPLQNYPDDTTVRPAPIQVDDDDTEPTLTLPAIYTSITAEEAAQYRLYFEATTVITEESRRWLVAADLIAMAHFEFGIRIQEMWDEIERFARNDVVRLNDDRYHYLCFLKKTYANNLEVLAQVTPLASAVPALYRCAVMSLQTTLTHAFNLGYEARDGSVVAKFRMKQAVGPPRVSMFEEQDKQVNAKMLAAANGFRPVGRGKGPERKRSPRRGSKPGNE